jgi:3-deoxy-D-arabino-heptulosonate 7-phosphate (DAHP) synthase class II
MNQGSLDILYAPNTSFRTPITNPRVGQLQNKMFFNAGVMNRLSDKGRNRMLAMMGNAQTGADVPKLINEVPRTGGTQIIN